MQSSKFQQFSSENGVRSQMTDEKIIEPQKPKNQLSKNEQQKIEKRIKEIEKEIPQFEEELKQIGLQLNLPEVVADHVEFQKFTEKYQKTENSIQKFYEEWDQLAESIE